MNPFPLPSKSAAYGGARHITEIDWRSKGLSDADEEVAAILLQLPRLISDSNSFFIWGGMKKKRQVRKRRRYVVIKKDPATSFSTEEPSTSSKQFESASSPDTPLISSFSPAATNNSKLLPKRKPVKRRRIENELLLVTQLEKERDLLRTKIENMRQQKDRAMAINTLLKRQQELIGGNHHHHQEKEKDAKLGEVNTSLTLGMQWQWTQPPSIVLSCSSVAATVNRNGGIGTKVQQQQPLIGNRTAVVADKSRGFLSVKLGVGPQKLIDLNLPADGCHVLGNPQPLDPHVDKKVMATLARQKRCAIYKATRRNLVKGILRY